MTRKKFSKLVRAYYTNLNMKRPDLQMNMKVFYDIARNAKIQHGIKMNYGESMYQHIYDVITLKVAP